MSDDNITEIKPDQGKQTFSQILKQVEANTSKGKIESVKKQLSDLLTKKIEHERSIAQIDAQISELRTKYEAGLL